jgi:hypothetical protein
MGACFNYSPPNPRFLVGKSRNFVGYPPYAKLTFRSDNFNDNSTDLMAASASCSYLRDDTRKPGNRFGLGGDLRRDSSNPCVIRHQVTFGPKWVFP